MKKLLVTSALAAVLSFSAEAKFQGAYAGAQVAYSSTSAKLLGSVPPTGRAFSVKPAGYGAGINGGYGCNYNHIYVGVDLQAGYNWAKETSNGLKTEASWNAGLGTRIGVHPMDQLLAYIYLGIGYSEYKLNYATGTSPTYRNISKTVNSWSYVPGIGASYMFSNKLFLDANYKYSTSFSQERPKYYKWDKKPVSHIFTVGAGYPF